MYTIILTLVMQVSNVPNTVTIAGFHTLDDCTSAYTKIQKEYAQSPMRVLTGKCINIPQ